MAGTTALASNDPREPRSRRGAARPDPASLVEALERFRDSVLLRLEQLEALVGENAELAGIEPCEREQALRERVAVLEAAQARLMAEVKRREQEWNDLLVQLEDDRRLLAQAWDEVERARIESQSSAAGAERVGAAAANASPAAAYRPPVAEPADDRTAREILQQFQALKGDVRRNAGGPGRWGR